MSKPQNQPFRVIWSQTLREMVRALGKKSIEKGLQKQFFSSLRFILKKLTEEPLAWGDPVYHLKSARLLVCHGIHRPFHLYYGVNEERRLVFVKDFAAFPGHGFDD